MNERLAIPMLFLLAAACSAAPSDRSPPLDRQASGLSLPVVTCESIHAVKIAEQALLDDCATPLKKIPITAVAAGAALRGASASACLGLTANGCAAYFRKHPEVGLADAHPDDASYTAFHYGAREDLRLPDGTRPMLYYKAASEEHAADWVVFLSGGAGKCASDVVQAESAGGGTSSVTDQGTSCYDETKYGDQGDTVAGTGFQRLRYRDFAHDGILGEAAENHFRAYNRVYLTKSNDFFIGATTKSSVVVRRGRDGRIWRASRMDLQGDQIVKGALAFLADPPAGVNSLRDARRVLFVMSSSGTHAVQRVDDWGSLVAHYTADRAHVGVMVNSSTVTGDSFALEDIDGTSCGSVYAADCTNFDDPPAGTTTSLQIVGSSRNVRFGHDTWLDYKELAWDGTSELGIAPGTEAHSYASVGALLDASCVAAEIAHPWKCRSPLYVMQNHLETPLFVAHSLRDASNADGVVRGVVNRGPDGAIPRWNRVAWPAGHANWGEAPTESLARLQFVNWVANRDNATGGAAGDAKGAGPIGMWASDCEQHEPEKHDDSFSSGSVKIGDPSDNTSHVVTLSEALRRWFEDRETMIRIDGYGQSDTVYPSGSTTAGCQAPTGNGH